MSDYVDDIASALVDHVPTAASGRITGIPGRPVWDVRYCACGVRFVASTADLRDGEWDTDRLLSEKVAEHMAQVIKDACGQTELHEDIKGGTTVMWTRQIVPLTNWDSKVMKNG